MRAGVFLACLIGMWMILFVVIFGRGRILFLSALSSGDPVIEVVRTKEPDSTTSASTSLIKAIPKAPISCTGIALKPDVTVAPNAPANSSSAAAASRGQIPVVFISLDWSTERRETVTRLLSAAGYHYTHARALHPTHLPLAGASLMQQAAPCRDRRVDNHTHEGLLTVEFEPVLVPSFCWRFTSLCLRPSDGTLKELVVLLSHLHAIHTAVHLSSEARYAIILEDDIALPFRLDPDLLAAAAPPGLALIQLLVSPHFISSQLVNIYRRTGKILVRRHSKFWGTGAYLIDRRRFKPFIDRIFAQDAGGNLTVDLRILHYCNTEKNYQGPSICSRTGYASDHAVYNIFPRDSYSSTVPLAESSHPRLRHAQSTVHRNHDSMNTHGLDYANSVVSSMKTGKLKLPRFASNCK